jgi:hypothetical protein
MRAAAHATAVIGLVTLAKSKRTGCWFAFALALAAHCHFP